MLFNNPISSEKADRIIEVFNIKPGDNVIDIGCGAGEFLIRTIHRYKCNGLGIDVKNKLILQANNTAKYRLDKNLYEFKAADVNVNLKSESFYDLAICLGSSHAFGTGKEAYKGSLLNMIKAVKSGGKILIGEGYWKNNPPEDYLKLIGDPVGIYNTYLENLEVAESLGLIPLYSTTSNSDEWDHFEWTFKMESERNDKGTPKLDFVRNWNKGYLKWGRDTMGFGFYLFQKP